MLSEAPFALFVVVEVSTDQLNKMIEEAFKGTEFSINPFWLPSSLSDYSDAPKKAPPGGVTEGTKPPVSSYESPFIGKTGQEVATWLKNKPEEAYTDIHFFAVLDKSAERGELVVGRQGGYDLKDMDNLEFMRFEADFATAIIYAAQAGGWEDMRETSKRSRAFAEIEY